MMASWRKPTVWVIASLLMIVLLFYFFYSLQIPVLTNTMAGSEDKTVVNNVFTEAVTLAHKEQKEEVKEKFPFVSLSLEPKACNDPNLSTEVRVMYVVAVLSKVENQEARQAVRQTWGSADSLAVLAGGHVRMFFVVAKGWKQTEIDKEAERYGDILQGDFEDEYNNLPLKVFAVLKWFKTRCHDANFLLKIDDDVFLNPFLLRARVSGGRQAPLDLAIYGRAWANIPPDRNKDSKWYVSTKQFSGLNYPTYVSGPVYVITGPAVTPLFEASTASNFMPMEDVLITGILAEAAGISVVGMGQLFYADAENIGLDSEQKKCQAVNSLIAIHHSPPDRLRELWKLLWLDNADVCSKYEWSNNNWKLRKSVLGRTVNKPKS